MNCDDQGENEAAIPGFAEMAQEIEKTGVNAVDYRVLESSQRGDLGSSW